jgi:hypothetical protein
MSRRQEGRFKGRRQPSASIYVRYICRCITNISLYEGLRRSVTCIPLSDLLMMLSSPFTSMYQKYKVSVDRHLDGKEPLYQEVE